MNCPYCNAPNDSTNQFCMVCGKPLNLTIAQPSARNMLWIVTGRIFVMLLFLWIMRAVLNRLSFVQATIIPDIDLRMTTAISIVVFITVITLVAGFIAAVARLWPQAFPRFQEASVIITTILYLIIFNQLYLASQQILPTLTDDPQATSDVMMLIGVGLVVLALVMVIRAFIIIYQALPRWLSAIQFTLPVYPAPQPTQENAAGRN